VRRFAFLTVAVLLAGCTHGPHVTTVAYGAGAARLAKGETLAVDFGTVNPSIGDSWYLVTKPDAAVLTERGPEFESTCGANRAGCDSHLTWQFTAAGKGSTSMVFRYCYRSQPDNCQPAPSGRGPTEPVKLDVTVG
jgi:predicted secreted protein